jgi:hypothetical protein
MNRTGRTPNLSMPAPSRPIERFGAATPPPASFYEATWIRDAIAGPRTPPSGKIKDVDVRRVGKEGAL